MAITAIRLDSVAPRGGPEGSAVVVLGSGFGVVAGQIIFDPLSANGGPYVANAGNGLVTLWQDDRIEYTSPPGYSQPNRDNRFFLVQIEKNGANDSITHMFWVPDSQVVVPSPPSALGLDYQLPFFEAGTAFQDTDDPTRIQAADFNRMLVRVLTTELKLDQQVDPKDTARAATTANIAGTYDPIGGGSLRGRYTGMQDVVDGVVLVVKDRVLLKDQTAQDRNGVWVVLVLGSGADGVWERAPDFDSDDEVTQGALVFVAEGTVANKATGWLMITPDPVTIGGASGSLIVFQQTAVQLAGPTKLDKNLFVATPTSGDGSATGLNLSAQPIGYVDVQVRGVSVSVGDAVKTESSYFSADGGTTAKGIEFLAAGDQLIWNGGIAQVEILTSDRVDFLYVV